MSPDVEVEQNRHEHIDGRIRDPARRKAPLPSGGYGFIVEAGIE